VIMQDWWVLMIMNDSYIITWLRLQVESHVSMHESMTHIRLCMSPCLTWLIRTHGNASRVVCLCMSCTVYACDHAWLSKQESCVYVWVRYLCMTAVSMHDYFVDAWVMHSVCLCVCVLVWVCVCVCVFQFFVYIYGDTYVFMHNYIYIYI